MVCYSHLFKNFRQFVVVHIVKGFGIVNKGKVFKATVVAVGPSSQGKGGAIQSVRDKVLSQNMEAPK